MEKRCWIVMLAIVFLAIMGCGRSEAPVKSSQPTVKQIVTETVVTAKKGADMEALKKEAEEQQARREEEARRTAIEEVETIFGKKVSRDAEKETQWEKELRGGTEKRPFFAARELYEKFSRMRHTFVYFDPQVFWGGKTLRWEDVQVSKKDAESLLFQTGIQAAKALLGTLNLSREAREQAGYVREGEGGFRFDEGTQIIGHIVDILKAIGADPGKIGTSAEKMRQFALKDLKERIAIKRAALKVKDEGAETWLASVIREGIRDWKFTPKQLGVTNEEMALLKKEGEG